MTDEQLEQRLRDWYHADIPNNETAPAALRSTVATIPQGNLAPLPRSYHRRAIRMLAVAAILSAATVGGALVTGSGIIRAPSVVAPSDALQLQSSPVSTHRLARNGAIAVTREGAIALIDAVTGKTVKTLPVDPAGDLTWASDGRRLAYTAARGVWVMDVSDGISRQILTCGEGPDGCTISWAPDGSRIAVAHGDTLELVDPDGSNRTTLFVQEHPVNYAGLTQPTWSPDGTRIAFNGWIGSGTGLYTINRDGSDPAPILGPVQGIGTFDPAWSPDGSTIAYIGSTDIRVCRRNIVTKTTSCDDQWQLHVMSLALDGAEPHELHDAGTCYCVGFAPSLAWSPDGTSLAFVGSRTDSFPGGLTVMNADGTGLRQVTDDANGPAWQPVP
jgi:Tol biopolymer transport system component